jgi:hypothetical protein
MLTVGVLGRQPDFAVVITNYTTGGALRLRDRETGTLVGPAVWDSEEAFHSDVRWPLVGEEVADRVDEQVLWDVVRLALEGAVLGVG